MLLILTCAEEWEEFNNSIETKYGSVQVKFLLGFSVNPGPVYTSPHHHDLRFQDGFNMVFGKDASVGYVCGIESAVEAGGAVKVGLDDLHAEFTSDCHVLSVDLYPKSSLEHAA